MGRVKKDGTPVTLGETVADKLVASIEASRHRPVSRLLFGLGIRHVGGTVAEASRGAFRSVDALAAASAERIADVEGVGPKIAASVRAFFDNPDNRRRAREAAPRRACRSRTSGPNRERPQTLAGLTFVLTGGLEALTRDEATAALKALGREGLGKREQEDVVRGGGGRSGQQVRQGLELGVPSSTSATCRRILESGTASDVQRARAPR